MAWLGRLGGALAAAAGLYAGYVSVRGSGRLVWPARRPFVAEPGGAASPADLGLPYEDVRFTTADGALLSGWLVPAARETSAAVVLLHGHGASRVNMLSGFVPWLREHYTVLTFDFRGHGLSQRAPVTLGVAERRDVAAAVELLTARGLGPIALMGISMGAAAAILAAPDLPVAAVVADAAYARLAHPIANRMREERHPFAEVGAWLVVAAAGLRTGARLADPIDRVAAVAPRALLLIAPREDRLIDWRQSEELFAAAGDPKQLLVLDGADHSEAHELHSRAYESAVLAFLARHL